MQPFLVAATVYLAAAVVAVPLAKRLGLGSVLGYLVAGVVIGPSVLGFVGAKGQDVMHAAEFGVVMMLFVVGLELEPALLRRLRGALAPEASAPAAAAHGGSGVEHLPGWQRALVTVGAVALVVGVGRTVVPAALRRIARARLRETFTAAALLLVIGIAVLMQVVGLSPALGTFLGGVVLATSEFRHELESDLEPFKGLLLGLFFIAVGASIDFPLVGREAATVAGLVVGLVAVKALVLLAVGTGARMGPDQRLLFALALAQGGEFCFVLLGFAVQNRVLPARLAALLVAAVALSMALTPLLLVAWARVVAPRAVRPAATDRPHDDVHGEHPVIIVGFGDFGSTVGRYLEANGVGTTVLDLDSDRVDLLRRLGLRVFYGDASREELLRAAGAERAKLVVLASGDTAAMRELAGRIRHAFPHLVILARASGRVGAYELLDAGVPHVVRESFDGALHLGAEALALLGRRRHDAWRAAQRFRRRDDADLRTLATVFRDEAAHLSMARAAIRELERSLRADAAAPVAADDGAWDPETLRAEFRERAVGASAPPPTVPPPAP